MKQPCFNYFISSIHGLPANHRDRVPVAGTPGRHPGRSPARASKQFHNARINYQEALMPKAGSAPAKHRSAYRNGITSRTTVAARPRTAFKIADGKEAALTVGSKTVTLTNLS